MVEPVDTAWIRDKPYTEGVINRFQSRYISESAAEELMNVDLEDPARPAKRDGYAVIGAGATGIQDGNRRIAGLGYLDAGSASRLLVAAVSDSEMGAIYTIADPDAAAGWTQAKTSEGVSLNVDTKTAKMLQGNDLLWIIPGTSREIHAMTSASLLIPGGSEQGSPPRGSVDGSWMFQRVWLLVRESAGVAIYWSKLRPVASDVTGNTAFDRTLQRLELGATATGEPVAMAPWNGQSLVIYFERAILEVIVNNSQPENSAIRVLEPRIGCGARDSIVTIGQEQYFLDQYGQFRSLAQTITGAQQGVRAEPLSELIFKEVPRRLNRAALDRVRAELLDDKVYLFIPRDADTEAQHAWVWDTVRRSWTGPWEFAHPISAALVSDIRGRGLELYLANGNSENPTTAVYRAFAGSYSDAGEPIRYRETTRCWDLGVPEMAKDPQSVEVEIDGDLQARANVFLRTAESSGFILNHQVDVLSNSDASFPLTDPDDFPLIEAGEAGSQFPLTEALPLLTRSAVAVHEPSDGDFPVNAVSFPIYADEMPVFAGSPGPRHGRFVQVRIEEVSAGKRFERAGYRVQVRVLPSGRDEQSTITASETVTEAPEDGGSGGSGGPGSGSFNPDAVPG